MTSLSLASPSPITVVTSIQNTPQVPEPTTPYTLPIIGNNSLPHFDQVAEAASLRHQAKPKRAPVKNSLDKYTKGINIPIHDAHPDVAYELIAPQTLNEWRGLKDGKLLAIPFENDAINTTHHEAISRKIFTAIEEITQAPGLGVAAPTPNEESICRERMPLTFLVYNLGEIHCQILTQQTVWASAEITFHITTPPMKCPSFMFAIRDLRTLEGNLVRDAVRSVWDDEITTTFVQEGILALPENERDNATQTIQRFMDSMWVERLDTRLKGGGLDPTFNVFTNNAIIKDVRSWGNIRNHLVNRDYSSSKLGQAKTKITPFHCTLCHGVDHPRGLCPFPSIDGWLGPKKKPTQMNQKRKGPK